MGSASYSDIRLAVSVIVTVYNEGPAVEELLASLARQTRPPDEVVIVDGGSQDDTLQRLQAAAERAPWPLCVLERPGANISQGRNAAVQAARGPLIAGTDAGVRLDPGWLKALLEPFEAPDPPDVVAGFFVPDARSTFEVALAATTLPAERDVRPERFLPSSRSIAYRKAAWEAVGGYPEWLDYCEDLIFDLRLRDRGYRFVFVPGACVHFQPRRSLPSFFRQYYRYARGDGKADLWAKRHAVRYLTYLGALPASAWLVLMRGAVWAVLPLAGVVVMLWTPYKRLLPRLSSLGWPDRFKALLWVPVIRVVGDVAKMLGYPVGVLWRRRHRSAIPNWRSVA